MTGKDADENATVSLSANIDRALTYEKDYLPRPGRSFFPLERRHAETALNDTDLTLVFRIQRTKEIWFDPTFEPPYSFVEELRAAADCIDVEQLGRSRFTTTEDYVLSELEPALARCVPAVLTDLIRRKMQSIATCHPGSRYWCATGGTDYLILAGEPEAEAARALRLNGEEDSENEEAFAANNLLFLEVRNLEAQTQFGTLIRADLKYILRDFSEILRPLTQNDVDVLIARYDLGPQKERDDLLILLSCLFHDLSDDAWSWVEGFVNHQDNDLRGTAYKVLAHTDPIRFGRILAADDWSWGPEKGLQINNCGTDALIEATSNLPLDAVAPRLAPWRLLKAVGQRGATPAEVRLAAEIFGRWLMDEESNGATLEAVVDARDFEPVFQHAPDIVEQWLEGCCEPTAEFMNRAHKLAIMPLCEALLTYDSCKGVQLWRVLHDALPFRRIGAANVEELWHMVFRVPDSPDILTLRGNWQNWSIAILIRHCLISLLLLPATARSIGLLIALRLIRRQHSPGDESAQQSLRDTLPTIRYRLRALGRMVRSIQTTLILHRRQHRYRWAEACARHWWKTFLRAPNPTEAYAAWVLFVSSADRRAFVWMQQEIETAQNSGDFFKLKMTHFQLNRENLMKALQKREDRIDRNFLYSKVFEGVGPWAR